MVIMNPRCFAFHNIHPDGLKPHSFECSGCTKEMPFLKYAQ